MTQSLTDLSQQWLRPDWQLPAIHAWVTTRAGDYSAPPYEGFNTADHVGDNLVAVMQARAALGEYFQWQKSPQWLRQVHGTAVVEAQADGQLREADAVFTAEPGQVCTLHTADCLPVFVAATDASWVGLAHAGWRGLADGVLANLIHCAPVAPAQLVAWLGPAIGPAAFEVGPEVVEAALASVSAADQAYFKTAGVHAGGADRQFLDLYLWATLQLRELGCHAVSGGGWCTFTDPRFYSYRHTHRTGRLLSLIWIDPQG